MNIEQLISPDVPVLTTGDTGSRALEIMDDSNLQQLPVVTDENYVALVAEDDLLEWAKPEEGLDKATFLTFKPAIINTAHPFEAMRLINQMQLVVLPVVDNERKYLGAVTKDALLKYITENSGIDAPGGVIVLEVPPRNYTLYEIARICENEDMVIMNTQVHANELGMLEITLKLNRTVLDPVVASLERHNYHVKEVFGEDHQDEDIAGKYNLLMNYINM